MTVYRGRGQSRGRRGFVLAVVCLAALMALPEMASAVLEGRNGRILFVSGRGEANDNTAKLYLRRPFGGVNPIPSATGAQQHRHPTWSPDRTRIAYAHGPVTAGQSCNPGCDIFILNLTNPAATPQNITNSTNVTDDRPAWSPDGTKLAWESENADGSNQLNIKLRDLETGTTTNFTDQNAGFEWKPAWTPDSQTLYYTVGALNVANAMDIVRKGLAPGSVQQNVAASPAVSEFQSSISPNGNQMCFTRGTQFGSADAQVVRALANGGGQTNLTGAEAGSYNCTYSPDGTKIAFVQGLFASGDLMQANADGSGQLITLENTAARFDGNPDWAPDGRPRCENQTVDTKVNTPVTFAEPCFDTGPAYERTEVRAFVPSEGQPSNGTVTPGVAAPPQVAPAEFTYTPNQGFTGTDSFKVRSFDLIAFGPEDATVTINVDKQSNEFEITNVKKNKKKGSAQLTVDLEEPPGDLALATSKKVKGADARVESGSVKLRVKAKGKAKKKLKRKGKAKVNAAVTYTPDLGDANTKTRKVKLKKKKRR